MQSTRYHKPRANYLTLLRLRLGYRRKLAELRETVSELESALHEALDLAARSHSQAQQLKLENQRLREERMAGTAVGRPAAHGCSPG